MLISYIIITSECVCLWLVKIFSINKMSAKLKIVTKNGKGNYSFYWDVWLNFSYDSGNKCNNATDKNKPPEKAYAIATTD